MVSVWRSVWIVEPKGALVLWKFKFCAKNHLVKVGTLNWCRKHTVYIHKDTVQRHLCLIEGVYLSLKGKQGVFSIKKFLRFHYIWPNATSRHYDHSQVTSRGPVYNSILNSFGHSTKSAPPLLKVEIGIGLPEHVYQK